MKLCAYVRVSTELQSDNTSLDFQRTRIQEYCSAQGHEVIAIFWDIESASGRVRRPGFQAALDCIDKSADGLIALKLDRFARSVIQGLKVACDLKKKNKQLILMDVNLDTSTPIGQCIFTVLLAFAELERKTIRQRSMDGMQKKRPNGEYFAGHPPYGWNAVDGILVANSSEQENRQKIFRWFSEYVSTKGANGRPGTGYSAIARRLNDSGVPAKRGGSWTPRTIRQIIQKRSGLIDELALNDTSRVGTK